MSGNVKCVTACNCNFSGFRNVRVVHNAQCARCGKTAELGGPASFGTHGGNRVERTTLECCKNLCAGDNISGWGQLLHLAKLDS